MKTLVSIVYLNLLVAFGSSCVLAQQSGMNSSIEDTSKFIETKVNGEGSISYHQEINHPAGGHYDYGQNETYSPSLSANPQECSMGSSLNFKAVKSATVMSATEAYAETKSGRDGWVATNRPNYYVVAVESSKGERHIEFAFRRIDSANQVRDAILHAVDLCGKDAVLSGPIAVGQAAASITLDQTIDFINKSFATEGAFDYTDGNDPFTEVRYCCHVPTLSYKQKIASQSVAMQGTQLTYILKAVRVTMDESPVLNNKGDIAKGHDISEHRNGKAIVTEKPADRQASIDLATTKALKVEVHNNDVGVWTSGSGSGPEHNMQDTTPATYSVVIVIPPADVRGYAATQLVGTFFDEDHANRVAKAYSHAIDLLHRREDKVPSIF